MSRYLTPTKIGLLLLIRLYCSTRFPIKSSLRILSLVASILVPKSQDDTQVTFSFSLADFRKELTNGHDHDDQVWAQFALEVSQLNNLDCLFNLFDKLPNLFQAQTNDEQNHDRQSSAFKVRDRPMALSKTSLAGAFVRRAHLEFERLQFHNVMQLWRKFELFRMPLLRRSSLSPMSIDIGDSNVFGYTVTQLQSINQNPIGPASDHLSGESEADVERLFDFQIQKMQKHGTRLPKSSTTIFKDLLHSSDSVKSGLSHYVSFLDSWYAGDYLSAFQNLHRYHDYALNSKDRSNYQYALLNMAILQADFKCRSEAIVSMKEAITTARENQDVECLNFCLSWLYHFQMTNLGLQNESHGQLFIGSEPETLSYMKAKTRDEKLWNILSSTLLCEARSCLSNGRRPIGAFERVHESSDLNTRNRLCSTEGSQLLVKSVIFARFGLSNLAKSYCDLVENSHEENAGIDNLTNARCRTVSILVLAGEYETAHAILEVGDKAGILNFKAHRLQKLYQKLIGLKRSLHNNNLQLAGTLFGSLRSFSKIDTELHYQFLLLKIEYLKRQRNFSGAFRLIGKSVKLESSRTDIFQKVKMMTAKALLFCSCGHSSKGLSVIVRAVVAAFRARILYALWEAVGALALILIGLEEYGAACAILEAIVYQASECCDGALIALIQNALADAWTGLALIKNKSQRQLQCLLKALNWLDRVQISHEQIEDFAGQSLTMAKKSTLLYSIESSGGAL